MTRNEYHLTTHWRVAGSLEEVIAVLGDVTQLPRWWPSVYLDAQELEPGDDKGIGKVVSLYMKGWLPDTLRWSFRVVESNVPHGFALEAWGDFVGRGAWTLSQDGECVLSLRTPDTLAGPQMARPAATRALRVAAFAPPARPSRLRCAYSSSSGSSKR